MAINLSKDNPAVSLRKDVGLRATISWPSTTDYDLGAEVVYADGHVESVAAFGAGKKVMGGYRTPPAMGTADGKIRHLGDVKRGGGETAQEVLEVELSAEILAVVPWAYSARSNGTGSFRRYHVTMTVTDGSSVVKVDAVNASANDNVYTCVPGMITNLPNEGPRVVYLEQYSAPNSENRTLVKLVDGKPVIVMNGGHENEYKR